MIAAEGGNPGQSRPARTQMLAGWSPFPRAGRAGYGWVYELATMQGGAASVMLPINQPFRRVEADE